MILYYSLISIFILNAIAVPFKKILFFISVFWIAFITCFRGVNIGNDTISYIWLFRAISKSAVSDFLPRYEIGYVYLNKVIYWIFPDEQALLIITGLITWICVSVFIYNKSENPSYSLFLILTFGFASFFMSGIRETLAIVFCLIGFFFIQKRQFIPFLAVVAFATMFHSTAAAFILAYPVYHLKLKRKQLFTIAGLTFVSLLLFDKIAKIFASLYPHYGYYLAGVYSMGGIRLASFLNFLLIFLFFCGCRFICEKYHLENNKNCIGITNLLYIGACVLLVSFPFNLLDRIALYYDVFIVIAIPNIILKYNQNSTQLIVKALSITILFIAYFSCVQYFRPEWNHIYPYQFYIR